jgi:hypothetical protein
MKLIMENWRDFKEKIDPMPKLSPPGNSRKPDPNYPDMVKGRKSRRIDADPEDILSALRALEKDRNIFKKSDRTLNMPTLPGPGENTRKQLGLFVNDVEDSLGTGGMSPEVKKEIEKKIANIRKMIRTRDEMETADTIHMPPPEIDSDPGSSWYDAINLREAIGHVEDILEMMKDGTH